MILGQCSIAGVRPVSHARRVRSCTDIRIAAETRENSCSARLRRSADASIEVLARAGSGVSTLSVTGAGIRQSATQPCRCGHGGPGRGACGRAPRCQTDYQGKISGPLMDRIDLQVEVPPVTAADLALPAPAEGTAEASARVLAARTLQLDRSKGREGPPVLNAQAEGDFLEAIVDLDPPARALLARAAEAGGLSARGWTRTLRLARTIADLEGSGPVRRVHIAEALIYRRVAPAIAGGPSASISA